MELPEIPKSKPRPNKGRGGKREKIVLDELLTRQVASLLVGGMSTTQIAQELDLSFHTVKRLANTPEVRAMVKDVGEGAMAEAKAQIRQAVAGLAGKIIKVIEAQLSEGNLDAVKIGLKIIGLDAQEPVQAGVQNLTVVLPSGATEAKTVQSEVVYEQEN